MIGSHTLCKGRQKFMISFKLNIRHCKCTYHDSAVFARDLYCIITLIHCFKQSKRESAGSGKRSINSLPFPPPSTHSTLNPPSPHTYHVHYQLTHSSLSFNTASVFSTICSSNSNLLVWQSSSVKTYSNRNIKSLMSQHSPHWLTTTTHM